MDAFEAAFDFLAAAVSIASAQQRQPEIQVRQRIVFVETDHFFQGFARFAIFASVVVSPPR